MFYMTSTGTGVKGKMYTFVLLLGYVCCTYGQETHHNSPGGLILHTLPPLPDPKIKSLFQLDESLLQSKKVKIRSGKDKDTKVKKTKNRNSSETRSKKQMPQFNFGSEKREMVPLFPFVDSQIMKEIFPMGFTENIISRSSNKNGSPSYSKSVDDIFNAHLQAASKKSTDTEVRQYKERQKLNLRQNIKEKNIEELNPVHFGFPIDLGNDKKREVFPNGGPFKANGNGNDMISNALFDKLNGFLDESLSGTLDAANGGDSGILQKIHCRTQPHYNDLHQLQEASYEERLNGHWHVRMCAPGTGYNESQCGCTNVLPVSHEKPFTGGGCRPDVSIKFQGPVLDSSGNNFTIDAHDVSVHDGGAIFNGSNHLFIWRYKGYDYRDMLQISFKFKPSYSRSIESYTLVSNCEGEGEPSFGILFNGVSNKTLFFLQTDAAKNKHSLIFDGYTDIWNDVYFRYNNGTMMGRVNNQVRSKPVLGNIQIRPDALVFAECKKYGNYKGQLKDITIYTKCLPGLDWKVESYLSHQS